MFEYFVGMKAKGIVTTIQNVISDHIVSSLAEITRYDFSQYKRLLFDSFIAYYSHSYDSTHYKTEELLFNLSNALQSGKEGQYVNVVASIADMDLNLIHDNLDLFNRHSLLTGLITAMSFSDNDNVLDKLADFEVWNWNEFERINSRIKSGIGFKRRKLATYVFHSLFNGDSDKLEWEDGYNHHI